MLTEAPTTVLTDRAMASDVLIVSGANGLESRRTSLAQLALEEIRAIERACNRFDPHSALSQLNALGADKGVDPALFSTIEAAVAEHQRTKGRFDPRVLADLEHLGYDRSFAEIIERDFETTAASEEPRDWSTLRWEPALNVSERAIELGGARIDLGGIGKGVAVDRAFDTLCPDGQAGLIDIGGDGRFGGRGEMDQPWMIGIEDPHGGSDPVAVFTADAAGYATSSTMVRRWKNSGDVVHHLIDPATGRPGGEGLASVTVVASTCMTAEVDAKVAFLAGADAIASHCDQGDVAALWIDAAGTIAWSPMFAPMVQWVRP